MNEALRNALNEISDDKITEAANHKNRKLRIIFRAVAALLVLALLLTLPRLSVAMEVKAVAETEGSRIGNRPAHGTDAHKEWTKARGEAWDHAEAAIGNLTPFFQESATVYLSGTTENRVWSPVNAYIALAMLAEVTDGNSRQQILDALNTPDMDTLRSQVGGVWEMVYKNDGGEICTLANSLWLDENLSYEQVAMEDLACYHYASVYQADLQSKQATKALQDWLNDNTGNLLKKYTQNSGFPEQAVFTLASTVYLQSKWTDEFSSKDNTDGIFHSPGGDKTVTFMNKKLYSTAYYWGDGFGALSMHLKNGTQMWFILPDEGKSTDDVLAGECLAQVLRSFDEDHRKSMLVNLSVPKFDISSSGDLKEMFQNIGITDVFDGEAADFTALSGVKPLAVTGVNQAARIIIDEEGVKAASYIEIPGAGSAEPPTEIIDFVLDRPFLFVITGLTGIPIFTGVVNEP